MELLKKWQPYYKYFILFMLLYPVSAGFKTIKNQDEGLIDIDPVLKRSLLLTPELIDHYTSEIKTILNKHGFKGSVLFALNGKVVFRGFYGLARVEGRVKTDSTTVFQLASVSKQFTAMGVALLNNDGLLAYDDSVKKYIPEFPYEDITIRQLLNHTSGLQNYTWLIENHWHKKRVPDNEDLLDLLVKHQLPLNFLPGKRFRYSNTGYAVLASIIERISGDSYGVFMRNRVFNPVGMHNTYVYNPLLPDTFACKASGYVHRGRHLVHYEDDNNDGIVGDKGIYSCTDDLFKWNAALYSDILLPPQGINELFEYQYNNVGDTINYGLGWRLPRHNQPHMVYHNGWWHGYRATIRRYVDDKNALIILNNTNMNIFPIINEIEALIYPEMQFDSMDVSPL